jgi:hypothetical protein
VLAINSKIIDETHDPYGISNSYGTFCSSLVSDETALIGAMLNNILHKMIYSRIYVSAII